MAFTCPYLVAKRVSNHKTKLEMSELAKKKKNAKTKNYKVCGIIFKPI